MGGESAYILPDPPGQFYTSITIPDCETLLQNTPGLW